MTINSISRSTSCPATIPGSKSSGHLTEDDYRIELDAIIMEELLNGEQRSMSSAGAASSSNAFHFQERKPTALDEALVER